MNKLNASIARLSLETMSRDELRNLATKCNVPREKEKKNTVDNLVSAMEKNEIRMTSAFTIRTGEKEGDMVYCKKLRTAREDSVVYDSTVPAKPVEA